MVDITLAKRIKELRLEKGLKQEELAHALGISQRAVSRIETQQVKPSPQLLVDVAKFFGVSTDYLLGIED